MLQFFLSYDHTNVGDGQEYPIGVLLTHHPTAAACPANTGDPINNGVCHSGQWIRNTHANQENMGEFRAVSDLIVGVASRRYPSVATWAYRHIHLRVYFHLPAC